MPEPSTSNRPEVPSTINQRPRRQVKHKFIKTGNRRSLTDELYTSLIGPNSPSAPALIPVVERLSDNVSNFAELLAAKEFKTTDSTVSVPMKKSITPADGPATVEHPVAESKLNSKEPVNRSQKTLGIPMRRKGTRQTRTSNSLANSETTDTEPETANQTPPIASAPFRTVDHVVELNSMEYDSIVTIEETDDRFKMDSSDFDGVSTTADVTGPVDFAEEVVIEETVTTTDFDQPSFAVTCDDAAAGAAEVVAEESDNEPIVTEEVNDVIDVSDSLSFLNDSDDSDSKSVVDAPLSSSPFRTNDASKPNDTIDMDENSGSIILVSPCDPLEVIAATEEITSTTTTFESHLADDDTANDGDVDEIPLNGPRRRSKRKSKSVTPDEAPVNNDIVDCSVVITKSISTNKLFGNAKSSPKENVLPESNTKSETTAESPTLPQNNAAVENVISSSEDTTHSESNDRSGTFDHSSRVDASSQRPRRENAERVNYSVRRNYVSRQSTKNDADSMDVAATENIDIGVDVEAELEKSVIERPQPQPQPQPIEPKFKFKKTDQMRTYQRRQKARGTKKNSPSSSPPSSSSSSSMPSSSSTSLQSSPRNDQTMVTAQDQVVSTNVVAEQPIELTPQAEEISTNQIVDDASTTDGQTEPVIPKRRTAGRPRKSDARRKPPQQTKLPNSIEIAAPNIDASTIETIEKVEIVTSCEQIEEELPTTEAHEEIQIEFKAEVDEETEMPNERTAIGVTPDAPEASVEPEAPEAPEAPEVTSPEEDDLLPKVENLVISAEDPAIVIAINAMEVDICKMEIDEEKPKIDHDPKEEVQHPPSTDLPTDSVQTTIVAVDLAPTANVNCMEINSNDQMAIKEGIE